MYVYSIKTVFFFQNDYCQRQQHNMLLVRVITLFILCILANSLNDIRCYSCVAPRDYFCYPFVECEVTKVQCKRTNVYNKEAFSLTLGQVEGLACMVIDYDNRSFSNGTVDAMKKCVGVRSNYSFCEDSPLKPKELRSIPECRICYTDLCNTTCKLKVNNAIILIVIFLLKYIPFGK